MFSVIAARFDRAAFGLNVPRIISGYNHPHVYSNKVVVTIIGVGMYWQCFLLTLIFAGASLTASLSTGSFKEGGYFMGIVLMIATFFMSSAAMMQLLHILKLTFKG